MIEVALFVSLGWIVSICFHEFGHAIVAYWGGDTSVKDKGYLSLNPFKYIEPVYSLILPLLFLMMGGIGLPGAAVYINQQRLRNRWWQSAVSAAGPIASILTLLFMAGLFHGLKVDIVWWKPALAFLILVQTWGVLINLLPIPSIDGFGIIEPFLSHKVRTQLKPLYRFGTIGLFFVLWFVTPVSSLFTQIATTITQQVLGIPSLVAMDGYNLFKRWSLPLLLGMIIVFAVGRKITQKPEDANFERSSRLIEQKKFEPALAALDKALEYNPQHLGAWWQKGTVLCKLQQYEEALVCYQAALVIDPNIAALWQNSGLILAELQQPQQAIDMYNRALELEPDDVQLWLHKAELWAELQNWSKAIATIDRAVEVDSHSVDAWYQRACYQAQAGNADVAITSLQQAIQLNPTKRNTARTDPHFAVLHNNLDFHKLLRLD